MTDEAARSALDGGLAQRLEGCEAALARETQRTSALSRVAASIAAGPDLETTVQRVIDGAVELSGAAFGVFFYDLVDPGGERYTPYAVSGAPPEGFAGLPMRREAPGPTGRGVVRSPSYLTAPVTTRSGERLGALFLGHPQADVFGEREAQVVMGLALQAAVAIDNVRLVEASRRELEERRMAEQRQRLLLNELNHRVKNTLATVQSIAGQTLRSCADPVGFRLAFEARLAALSEAHNLLNAESWGVVKLTDLLRVEIAPYDPGFGRVSVSGDREVRLAANPAVALGMALHELATNAARYGALSTPEGRVTVLWRHEGGGEDGGGRLVLDWTEAGGPAVVTPAQTGFGAKLLKRGLATQLSGVVDITYDPGGLRCRMNIPLEALELSA